MICNLRRVSNETIDALMANPEEVVFFLYGPVESPKPGLLSRLFGPGRETPAEPRVWEPPAEDDCLDLDKAWHGIHYLLNFSDWEGKEPLSYLVTGGRKVGDVDVGYGPARALRSGQVRRFRDALRAVGVEELEARYDPAELTERCIYPTIWSADADDDPLGFLKTHFTRLLEFLDRCVENDAGLLVWLR